MQAAVDAQRLLHLEPWPPETGEVRVRMALHTGVYEESLALRRQQGDQWGIAGDLNNLGNVAYMQGDYARANSLYKESLVMKRDLGDKWGIAISFTGLGGLAAELAQADSRSAPGSKQQTFAERGVRLLAAAEALLQDLSAVRDPEDGIIHRRGVGAARSLLDELQFKRAWDEGRAMSMEQAIEYALGGN